MAHANTTNPAAVDAARWREVQEDAIRLVREALFRVTNGTYDGLAADARDRFDDLLAGSIRALEVARMPESEVRPHQVAVLVVQRERRRMFEARCMGPRCNWSPLRDTWVGAELIARLHERHHAGEVIPCQCEHAAHDQGGAFGVHVAALPGASVVPFPATAVSLVETEFGTFPMCQACVDARHGDLEYGGYRVGSLS